MMNKQFEVGDRVRAIGNENETGYSITINGWEGIVTEAEDEDGGFKALDEQNGDPAYQLKSQYFELVKTKQIKSIYKPPKGMKNLAAAAKALKYSGPTSKYEISMTCNFEVDAHDDEEAIEKKDTLIKKGFRLIDTNFSTSKVTKL